jgi:predicted  nucleic acid-binding Zn-ribbon protein
MPVTDTLRECHRLRRHLRDLQAEIDRGPRVLANRRAAFDAAKAEHAAHHDAITKAKLKQREDEGTLKQTETRLAKLEAQLLTMGVPKEVAAKESEIAQAKAKKDELEDAILSTIGELEERAAATPAAEAAWAAAQAEFAEFQREAAERLERLRNDQTGTKAALEQADAALPEEVRGKYDSLVKAHGPDALAAVVGKACQGCRKTVTEQRWVELRGGGFALCPYCGKMLYPSE